MQAKTANLLTNHGSIDRLERIVAALMEGMVQRVTYEGESVSFEEAASRDCVLPLLIAQAELWAAPLLIDELTEGVGSQGDDDALFGSALTIEADEAGNARPFNVALLNVISFVLHNALADSPQDTLELKTLTKPQLPRVFNALAVKRWPTLRAPKQDRQPIRG